MGLRLGFNTALGVQTVAVVGMIASFAIGGVWSDFIRLVALLLLLVGSGMLWWLKRSVLSPLDNWEVFWQDKSCAFIQDDHTFDKGEVASVVETGKKLAEEFDQLQVQCKQLKASEKDLEATLAGEKRRHQELFDVMGIGLLLVDKQGVIKSGNDNARELLGTPVQEGKAQLPDLMAGEEDFRKWQDNMEALVVDEARCFQVNWKHVDIQVSTTVALVASDDPDYLIMMLENTALKEQLMTEAKQSKQLLHMLLESTESGVIIANANGDVVMVNQKACDLLGITHERAADTNLLDTVLRVENHRVDEKRLGELLGQKQALAYSDSTLLVSDGRQPKVDVQIAPVFDDSNECAGTLCVMRDVAIPSLLNAKMAELQRLQSIALLAGGIAHDFNNILTVLVGNLAIAGEVNDNEDVSSLLENSLKAANQAKHLTIQLLNTSKGGVLVKEEAGLNHLIHEAVSFVLRGSHVRVKYELPNTLWDVDVDVGQISQVFQNLVINAKQAMHGGGTIWIIGSNISVTDATNGMLDKGDYVKVSIEDNGPGVPVNVVERIFEPCYTTKEEGNGLGLVGARSIVQRHGGELRFVQKEEVQGACFEVYIPASAKKAVRDKQDETLTKPSHGTGSVLVLDDEPAILQLLQRLLPAWGYTIECAEDGEDALEIIQEALQENRMFDAAILDLTVPGGMGGMELMTELKRVAPDVRCIVSSGYANDPVMASYSEYGFDAAVSKPFEATELSEVLNRVLSENLQAGADE